MVQLTIGVTLAGTLVQLFVMKMSSYVELESILGLDATHLDGVNQPWTLQLNVPSIALPCVQRLKCTAMEVRMPMVA